MAYNVVTAGFIGDTAQAAGATTRARTLGAAVQVGDVVVVFMGWYEATTLSTVEDNLGNTYTLEPISRAPTDTLHASQVAWTVVSSAGTPTITATWSGSTQFRSLAAQAWRDSAGNDPAFDEADESNFNDVAAGANVVTTDALTVDDDASLLVACTLAYNYEATTPIVGTSPTAFTASAAAINLTAGVGGLIEWAQVDAGSRTATFGLGAEDDGTLHVLAFSPATSGGGVENAAAEPQTGWTLGGVASVAFPMFAEFTTNIFSLGGLAAQGAGTQEMEAFFEAGHGVSDGDNFFIYTEGFSTFETGFTLEATNSSLLVTAIEGILTWGAEVSNTVTTQLTEITANLLTGFEATTSNLLLQIQAFLTTAFDINAREEHHHEDEEPDGVSIGLDYIRRSADYVINRVNEIVRRY